MRNAILVLLVLGAAAGLWWVTDREPNLSAGQAQLDAEREALAAETAAATVDPASAAALADSDPYETVDDPEYKAARAEREKRLEQIREDAERRRQSEGSGLTAAGGGRGRTPASDDDLPEEPLTEPDEDALPEDLEARQAALADRATERAGQLGIVPADWLNLLFHRFLVERFGPDYTLAQKNAASPAYAAIEKTPPQDLVPMLEDALAADIPPPPF